MVVEKKKKHRRLVSRKHEKVNKTAIFIKRHKRACGCRCFGHSRQAIHSKSPIFIDFHIFVAFSVDTARQEAENYRQQFKRPIPLRVLNERLSNYIHAYTLYSAVRPFGVSVILASYDKHDGPGMYMIEPSGNSYVSWLLLGWIQFNKIQFKPKKLHFSLIFDFRSSI